jgi:mono/diheme cytochrome c family protein
MKWHIALGMLSFVALSAILGILGFNELARMQAFREATAAREIEAGALTFENNCRPCHGPQGKGIEGVAPAINAADLFNGDRLKSIGFAGTVEDYVAGVIAAGRPMPTAGTTYPQRMPTWSQRFGGPLREDQIDSVVLFIMNWRDTALAEAAPVVTAPAGGGVGTDLTMALPTGDAANGKSLTEGALGCVGCHVLAAVGPAWLAQAGQPGIGARAETAFAAPDYTGKAQSAEQYLIESVVQSNAFVGPGFQPNIMPANYGERLSAQDLADILAYLKTLK